MKGAYQGDGARLGFQDTGAGLPVVFLHPTPLDGDYWLLELWRRAPER
jgi:pimeloyl-ACP methyl ester carboxylesterase